MTSPRLRFWSTAVVAAGASSGIIGFLATAFAFAGGKQFQLLAGFATKLAEQCVGWRYAPGDQPSTWQPNGELSSQAGRAVQHQAAANGIMEMLQFALAVTFISLSILLVALGGRYLEIRRENRKRDRLADTEH